MYREGLGPAGTPQAIFRQPLVGPPILVNGVRLPQAAPPISLKAAARHVLICHTSHKSIQIGTLANFVLQGLFHGDRNSNHHFTLMSKMNRIVCLGP